MGDWGSTLTTNNLLFSLSGKNILIGSIVILNFITLHGWYSYESQVSYRVVLVIFFTKSLIKFFKYNIWLYLTILSSCLVFFCLNFLPNIWLYLTIFSAPHLSLPLFKLCSQLFCPGCLLKEKKRKINKGKEKESKEKERNREGEE